MVEGYLVLIPRDHSQLNNVKYPELSRVDFNNEKILLECTNTEE